MTKIVAVEVAYRALASDVLAFIENRNWESAGAVYGILHSSVSTEWWLVHDGQRVETGNAPTYEISKMKSSAVLFLRDHLLATAGDRIWGLTFTLYPDGKFKIDYDYNKPEGYEETEETISLDEALKGLPNTGNPQN